MELSRQIDIFLFLFVGTLGMFLLSGGVVGVFIVYQKKLFKQQLLFYEMEAGYKEELLHSNIQQIEAERKRISRDLHDEVGSFFSTLSIKLDQMEAIYNASGSSEKLVKESKRLIDAGMKTVRRISHDLIPPALETFGLAAALEIFCEQQVTDKLDVEFYSAENVKELTSAQALAIYRVVQELFNNTIRHADANCIKLHINSIYDKFILTYCDDGKGFNLNGHESKKGIGLRNIDSRVSMINAKINYKTAPGKGVTIVIELPYSVLHNT